MTQEALMMLGDSRKRSDRRMEMKSTWKSVKCEE